MADMMGSMLYTCALAKQCFTQTPWKALEELWKPVQSQKLVTHHAADFHALGCAGALCINSLSGEAKDAAKHAARREAWKHGYKPRLHRLYKVCLIGRQCNDLPFIERAIGSRCKGSGIDDWWHTRKDRPGRRAKVRQGIEQVLWERAVQDEAARRGRRRGTARDQCAVRLHDGSEAGIDGQDDIARWHLHRQNTYQTLQIRRWEAERRSDAAVPSERR